MKRSQAQQEPAHGIPWGVHRSPANGPAGGTDYWPLTEPQAERGMSDMQTVQRERKSGRGQGRCQDDQPKSTAGLAQKKTVAGTPRHRREEEKRSSSVKFSSRPRPKNNNITKVVQIDTAAEALGLGGVPKESPLTTH